MKKAGLMVLAAAMLASAGCQYKLVNQKKIDWGSCVYVKTDGDARVELKQFQCGPASIVYGVARKVLRSDSDFPVAQQMIYDEMEKIGPTLEGFTGMEMTYGDEYDMDGYEALEMTFTSGEGEERKLMAQGYMSLAHDGSNVYISLCVSGTITNDLCEGALDDLFHDVETPISDQLPQ